MSSERASARPFWKLIKDVPFEGSAQVFGGHHGDVDVVAQEAQAQGHEQLALALEDDRVRTLLGGIFEGSAYLCGLIKSDLARLEDILTSNPDDKFRDLCRDVCDAVHGAASIEEAMRDLRRFKNACALLIALCDIGCVWPVMTVTRRLSETAQTALQAAVRFLFRKAFEAGDWIGPGVESGQACGQVHIADTSGYVVLAMGKFGAFELNYSSDIDLIVFYDAARAQLREGLEVQRFFVRITRDVVRLMDERTKEGYVFRTDLRLRPDPGATQMALSIEAAMIYYESFGQNWERAALIKARPVAGDISAGAAVLAELEPFIWRKYLDFAAISDIHAMKRQIHSFHGFGDIDVPGHNLKLGRGGIREIEFFVQTQQLIAGGRQRELRSRGTLETLKQLADRDWIRCQVREDLTQDYLYLRRLEHRLQMVRDEQTHELPGDKDALESFSKFSGYQSTDGLRADLIPVLRRVQKHFGALFRDEDTDGAGSRNLVFAGQDDDPGTVDALKAMGFSQPRSVIATVRSWHHGRYAAVRSARSRERLTALQGPLLEAFSETADADGAFSSFDRFLSHAPTGVQLFSLLGSKPGLLRLFADIMGSAPRLANILSRRRRLLDAVIDPRTFEETPNEDVLRDLVEHELARAPSYEEALDTARVLGSEQSFLLGVRVLSGTINADQAGLAYATLASSIICVLQNRTEEELGPTAGYVPGGGAVIIAMGKLGGYEMTASSDLDLILVYDHPDDVVQSDGARPLSVGQYYARFTQRLITALSAPTSEGSLYDVDMRLRPSGQQGPVATRFESFVRYQRDEAWTWEQMALTRARVVSGPMALRHKVEGAIRDALVRPRDASKVAADVLEMRARIAKEKGSDNIWDLKQVRGGLVDLEFIAQFLQLVHAAQVPGVLNQNTLKVFENLRDAGLLSGAHADILIPATKLIHNLTQVLRICIGETFDPASAPKGLKDLLCRSGAAPSFESLETLLRQMLQEVYRVFGEIVR